MTELNPYRCEKCKFYFRNFSDSEGQVWNKCNIGSCQIDVNRQILIDRVGCASHSSIKLDNDDVIWMTAEEEERRIRKDEREKVLDELEKRVDAETYEVEDRHNCRSIKNHIEHSDVKRIIEELRQKGGE